MSRNIPAPSLRAKRSNPVWIATRLMALAVTLCVSSAALAAETKNAVSEAVYRTNLGRAEDVALLIKQGVPPDQTDAKGVPLLALASARLDEEGIHVVKALLEAGADINAKDGEGRTALFYAAKQGNKDVVLHLMEKGIAYYHIDDNGDIARNYAHKAGHKELVTAMDEFVKTQGDKVRQQYNELNKTLQERYRKQIEEEEAKENEDQEVKPAAEPTPPPLTEPTVTPSPPIAATALKVRPEAKPEEFRTATRDLAFHSCAFQYWSFCRETGQTTELAADEMNTSIDLHKDTILDLQKALAAAYEIHPKYSSRVSERAKQHIFNRLMNMPSKTYRREHGVGKMEDMRTRCEEVAVRWEETPPALKKSAPKKGSGGNPFNQPRKNSKPGGGR